MPLAATRNQRVPRYAIGFDGTDDYASIPNSNVFNVDYVSVEALVMFPILPSEHGEHGAFWHRGPAKILYSVLGHKTYNKFQFLARVNDTLYGVFSDTEIERSKWYHVVGTYDGSYIRLYVNTVKESELGVSGVLDKYDQYSYIGYILGTDYLNGLIAYIRVYNRALTENEIRYNYYHPEDPIRPGLVLWLQAAPEYVGSVWKDISGYGNDAALYGPTLEQVVKVPVLIGAAVRNLAAVR